MRNFIDFFEEDFCSPFRTRSLLVGLEPTTTPEIKNFRNTSADIWEENGKVMAKIDFPGIDKKDIDIKVNDNIVEIKAEKKFVDKTEGKEFFREERSFSGFYKAFSLPNKIDPEKIEAKFENGVLEISAPKIEKETKKIEVK